MAILQNDNLGSKEVERLSAPTLTSTKQIKTRSHQDLYTAKITS